MAKNQKQRRPLDRLQNVVFIGSGKLGQSLANLAEAQGINTYVLGRNYIDFATTVYQSNLVLITTPDDEISSVVDELVKHAPKRNALKPIIVHCSGSLSSQVLSPLGDRVASCHPLNTFPNQAAAEQLLSSTDHGTTLFAEGPDAIIDQLESFFTHLGFVFRRVDSEQKLLYHVACVSACNFLSVLMHTSLDFAEQAGLQRNEFWSALTPIIQSTLDNIGEYGSVASLSGPIARGDLNTVKQHLETLEGHPDLEFYRLMSEKALEMSAIANHLDEAQVEQLIKQLNDPN